MTRIRLWLTSVGGVVAFAVLVWLYYWIPTLLSADAKTAEAFRGQLTALVGICATASVAIFGINKHFLDREKQRTDIFNTAIGHLASDDAVIRAGGVRALARMMRYSSADRARVLETFADVLRHRTAQLGSGETHHRLPSDISAILVALQRRTTAADDPPLNLSGVRLAGANLRGVDLRGARLIGADLTDADLRGARLAEADLDRAILANAELSGTDLRAAKLTRARLTGAVLRECVAAGTDFSGSGLAGADLRATDLQTAIGLTRDQIGSAGSDSTTRLPAELT
ncbi:pentapeptide repeat-containing protein [Nocardia sp. 2]|uniref:Pentapeptide repeat-containing protein n=1 Tax=Nocardia acididurans TaxID=2802282 RepID=A0ABS1MK42_9NOCA|nr:pentapeptide repeat-containing protein [Nocardia acididurans]MBL1080034.1 pentapeptide repeat-containing protein [Nocardia acididurans]